MGIEHIQLISDEEMQRKIAEYQIDAGLVTAENFATRSPAEQETIKDTLFEKYARNVNPYVALSSLEFAFMGLAKLFFKKMEGVPLTPTEETFYNQFKALVESHEMTLDASDWYFAYLAYCTQKVMENRAEYNKVRKLQTIGEF